MYKKSHFFVNLLWDLFCTGSIVGIWPRFIEPNLLATTQIPVPIPGLTSDLHNLRILHFSDLHLHRGITDYFLKKFLNYTQKLSPDIIVCTGDLLCRSKMLEKERLHRFLCQLKAPYGSYFVFGNHDYASYVSINDEGQYAIDDTTTVPIKKGFQRLFSHQKLKGKVTTNTHNIEKHQELCDLLAKTPFKILDNETKRISIGTDYLNICGLGDYMLGRHKPEIAFQNYDKRYPGVILCHNPDAVMHLDGYPGDIILTGHTHGAQVRLPWMWKKFITLENPHLLRGLHEVKGKKVYINRGLGGIIPFRWFSTPEIALFKLKSFKPGL